MLHVPRNVVNDTEAEALWNELGEFYGLGAQRAFVEGRDIHNTILPRHQQAFTDLRLMDPWPSKKRTALGERVLAYGAYARELACGDGVIVEPEEQV